MSVAELGVPDLVDIRISGLSREKWVQSIEIARIGRPPQLSAEESSKLFFAHGLIILEKQEFIHMIPGTAWGLRPAVALQFETVEQRC